MNILIFIGIVILVICTLLEFNKTDLTKDPKSPMYKWYELRLDNNIIISWNEVFASRFIGYISHLDNIPFQNWDTNSFITNSEDTDVFVVYYISENWNRFTGRSGYLLISKKDKKQISFCQELYVKQSAF